MAVDEGARTTAQLMQFVAGELQSAFSHIGRAMATYSETGILPPSMFDVAAPTNKRQKRKDKGQKRKPSAFNYYVKEKMAEIRGNEDEDHAVANGTTIFAQAVDEWKKLSDEEKKAYTDKFKAEEGEDEVAEDTIGDEDIEEDEVDHDEGENEEQEPEQEPAPQEPPKVEAPKVEPPQAAQPAVVKKEKKRKNAPGVEPKAEKEAAEPEQAAAEEPKSEKKKKKKKDKQRE